MEKDHTMVPGQLHVMLWHYFSPAPYPQPTRCHGEWLANLHAAGLIDHNEDFEGWSATDKGRAYVEMILQVPLPVMRWVDPRSKP